MIVDPDFVDHWKTRTLVALLGDDEASPVYVIRLWAHCQNRRTWIFDLPSAALKAICRFPGDAEKFESAMLECGFVARDGGSVTVVGWDEYNASLIAAWANGHKGGRPRKEKTEDTKKTHGLSMGNPADNPQVTHGVTDKSREDKRRKEEPKTKAQKPPAATFTLPEWIDEEAWKGFVAMRKKLRSELTDGAVKLAVSELARLKENGHDPKAVLEQSTLNGWKGLFELKGDFSKPKSVPKFDDWYRSDAGINRKASELGLFARSGETYASLRDRCESEMRKREQGIAA